MKFNLPLISKLTLCHYGRPIYYLSFFYSVPKFYKDNQNGLLILLQINAVVRRYKREWHKNYNITEN